MLEPLSKIFNKVIWTISFLKFEVVELPQLFLKLRSITKKVETNLLKYSKDYFIPSYIPTVREVFENSIFRQDAFKNQRQFDELKENLDKFLDSEETYLKILKTHMAIIMKKGSKVIIANSGHDLSSIKPNNPHFYRGFGLTYYPFNFIQSFVMLSGDQYKRFNFRIFFHEMFHALYKSWELTSEEKEKLEIGIIRMTTHMLCNRSGNKANGSLNQCVPDNFIDKILQRIMSSSNYPNDKILDEYMANIGELLCYVYLQHPERKEMLADYVKPLFDFFENVLLNKSKEYIERNSGLLKDMATFPKSPVWNNVLLQRQEKKVEDLLKNSLTLKNFFIQIISFIIDLIELFKLKKSIKYKKAVLKTQDNLAKVKTELKNSLQTLFSDLSEEKIELKLNNMSLMELDKLYDKVSLFCLEKNAGDSQPNIQELQKERTLLREQSQLLLKKQNTETKKEISEALTGLWRVHMCILPYIADTNNLERLSIEDISRQNDRYMACIEENLDKIRTYRKEKANIIGKMTKAAKQIEKAEGLNEVHRLFLI